MLDFVLSHREKFEKVFTSKSHAIMLESEDQVLTSNLAKLFAMNLSCKSSEKPCKICSSCLKIIDNNSLDTFVPLHQGFLNVFDKADNAFIAAYRKYDKNEDFEIRIEYYSAANIDGRVLMLVDPMLATGSSLVQCLEGLLHEEMTPKKLHLMAVIASAEGVDYVKKKLRKYDATLWIGNIDDELTAKAYIVPGLGDAGDLAYGEKE